MKSVSNILKVVKNFKTEMEAIQFFIKQRWNDKVECPFGTCPAESKIYNLKSGKDFKCSCCGKIFSYKTRTIFEDTKIPMRKWFMAIYLIVNHKKGISSLQLGRDIDVTQKTAWFMLQRIRVAMEDETIQFEGISEIDETYVKNAPQDSDDDNDKKGGGHSNKTHTSVVAFKQKGGDIKAFVTTDTTSITLGEIILDNIETESEIHTDEYNSYKHIRKFWTHKTVNHSLEYVTKDGIHTNSVEGFWALLKRGIKGNFHWLSKKHLSSYIKEFEYRYNNRENDLVFGDVLGRMLRV